ncbi:unnamed protein product, partial [Symbiodinium sp. CCMP2456]
EILLRRQQLGLRSDKKAANREAKANGKKKGLLRAKSGLKKKTKKSRGASIKVWPANRRDEWDEGMPGRWYADEWGNDWYDEEGEPGYYWDDTGCYEYAGDWRVNEDGLAEPVLSRRKRGKQAEKASSSKGPEKPKDKAKPKSKAKAKAKAKAKLSRTATAAAQGAADDEKVKPSRKKTKAKKEIAADAATATGAAASTPKVRKNLDDIDPVRDWVSQIDYDTEDFMAFKTQVRAFLPTLKGSTRLNIYWTRFSCGVTLHYQTEDGSNAKSDVGFFSFSKCNAGLCHAAEQLDSLAITDTEDELILEIKEKWKAAGHAAWAQFNADA